MQLYVEAGSSDGAGARLEAAVWGTCGGEGPPHADTPPKTQEKSMHNGMYEILNNSI